MSRMRSMTVALCALLAAGLLLCTSAPAQEPAQSPDPNPMAGLPPTLAVINGKPLPLGALQAAVVEEWSRDILDSLIRRRVIWDEAEGQGIDVPAELFWAELNSIRQQHGGSEGFQRMLHRQGLTETGFRLRVKTEMLLDEIVARRGRVTDEEIRAYYDKHQSKYIAPAKVQLFDLVTTDVEAAYTARRRINAGEDFGKVAGEMSVAPSADDGGDLGWVEEAQIEHPLMRATAFSLAPGQVSNPLLVEGKYHLLMVKEASAGFHRKLEDVRGEIAAAVREAKGFTREAVAEALVREAEIRVTWAQLAHLTREYAALKQIRVIVDGRTVELPRAPYLLPEGKLLVPVRTLVEAMGGQWRWKAEVATFIAEKGTHRVAYTERKTTALVNEEQVEVVPPRIEEGTLMGEPRPLVEGLGGTAHWDPVRNALLVTSTTSLPEG